MASSSSSNVKAQIGLFEKLLEFRILLQKPLEIANKFPLFQESEEISTNDDTETSQSTIKETLNSLISIQETSYKGKRKRSDSSSNDDNTTSDDIWKLIQSNNKKMKPKWLKTLDLWHSRAHYGSAANKSKLKYFSQTGINDQIEAAMQDDVRVLEKSRIRKELSQRIDRTIDSNDNNNYDLEVYDDRGLYSILLKTFITNSSGRSGDGMGKEDLEALRRYRQKRAQVDRRASKGRKIRYTVHTKLEHFMFPQPGPSSTVNIDRLFASLFQTNTNGWN